jgi:hypothetical protein
MKKLIVLFCLIFIVNFTKAQCVNTYDSTLVPICPLDLLIYNSDTIHQVYDSILVYNGDTAMYQGVFYDTLTNYLGCDSIYKIKVDLEPYTYEFYRNASCDSNYIDKYLWWNFTCMSKWVNIQYSSIRPKPVLFIRNDTIFLNDTAKYNFNLFPNVETYLIDCDSNKEYCWFFPLYFNSPGDTIKIPFNSLVPNFCNKLHTGNYKFGIKNSTSNYYPSWVSTLFDVECTNYSDCAFIDFSNISGKSELKQINDRLRIAPNPCIDELIISSLDFKIKKLEVINVVGQTIIAQSINNSLTHSINISSLSQGLYLLKCVDENGMVQQTKFVKQ